MPVQIAVTSASPYNKNSAIKQKKVLAKNAVLPTSLEGEGETDSDISSEEEGGEISMYLFCSTV